MAASYLSVGLSDLKYGKFWGVGVGIKCSSPLKSDRFMNFKWHEEPWVSLLSTHDRNKWVTRNKRNTRINLAPLDGASNPAFTCIEMIRENTQKYIDLGGINSVDCFTLFLVKSERSIKTSGEKCLHNMLVDRLATTCGCHSTEDKEQQIITVPEESCRSKAVQTPLWFSQLHWMVKSQLSYAIGRITQSALMKVKLTASCS